MRPFETLRRHKHAQTHTVEGQSGIWLTSEQVIVHNGCTSEIVDQVIRYKAPIEEHRAVWLDEMTNSVGERTKRQRRADEDAKAVGGLRSPHKSVVEWLAVEKHGAWLTS